VSISSYAGPEKDAVQSMNCGIYYNRRSRRVLSWMGQEPGSPIVIGPLFRTFKAQGFSLDVEKDNKSVYNESQLWEALGRYHERTPWKPDERVLYDVFKDCYRIFGSTTHALSPLNTTEPLTMMKAVKLDKNSGAPEFVKKREAFALDYPRFLRIRDGKRAPEPCIAIRRIQHGEEGPKTRLVWSYPLSMTLFEATYARPLIEHFLMSETPMAFGKYRWELAGRLLSIQNSSVRLAVDYTKFDATIHPKLVNMAFQVLRTHFPMSEQIDNDFEKLSHYFIHTPIVMPDGCIYRKRKGVPSGSYFTQLIDSIVNYAALRYVSSVEDFKYSDDGVQVLGDDSICGISRDVSIKQIAGTLYEHFGLTVNVEKSEVSYFPQTISFLGHEWKSGIVDREQMDSIKRLAFPERYRDKSKSRRDQIKERLIASLADSLSAWEFFKMYYGPGTVHVYRDTAINYDEFMELPGWQTLKLEESLDKGIKSVYKPDASFTTRAILL
jgi:hypothetical protein